MDEFEVVFQYSGKSGHVSKDQTILEVAESLGIEAPNSCREGVCGTCMTEVIEGEVDHRDRVLAPSEREVAMSICCSRSLSPRLVLDL